MTHFSERQLRDAIILYDNEVIKDLAHRGRAESDVMLSLTRKTIREARAMKIITLVTLVYLPASFTSVCLYHPFNHR